MSFAEIKAYPDSFSRAAVPVKGRNKSPREGKMQGDWQPYVVHVAHRNVQAWSRALSMALGVREIPEDGGRQCT